MTTSDNDNNQSPQTLHTSGKLTGNHVGKNGVAMRYSLNPQPPKAYYEYVGTMTALRTGAKTPIIINGKVVSKPLHVGRPGKSGKTIGDMITAELERVACIIEDICLESLRASSGKNILLATMTLTEALDIFLKGARLERSKSESVRKEYSGRLKRLSKQLAGIQISKIDKKALSRALPGKSDRTKATYLTDLRHFITYAESQQRCVCGLEKVIDTVQGQLKLKDPVRTEVAAARSASNGTFLPDAAEEMLNKEIRQNISDPYYVALALSKGGGLDNQDIRALKIRDVQTFKSNEVIFVKLSKTYISATQDYTFPLFPWESTMINKYLQIIKQQYGDERMDGDKYLLSVDDGTTPIDASEITKLCRRELQKLRFGYADLIGDADLSRDKGIRMLRETYKDRLQRCGISGEYDDGAMLFMMHQSLGNNTQADHYRSFTGETGRQFLLDCVMLDRRFLPKQVAACLTHAGRGSFELRPEDNCEHQATIEFDLMPGEIAEVRTKSGAFFEILSVSE